MIKTKIVFDCFSFPCEKIAVECSSMQAEKSTWSLRVKILWLTGEFSSCLFDLQNVCRIFLIDRNDKNKNSFLLFFFPLRENYC